MLITTAKGTVIGVSDLGSPYTYASIGQVRSITGPTVKPHIVDVTTHDTPGFWNAKLAVLIAAGDISFEINWNINDATHNFVTGLWSYMIALALTGMKITFPNAFGTLVALGYVGQHEFMMPVDNVLSAKIQMALTGAIITGA